MKHAAFLLGLLSCAQACSGQGCSCLAAIPGGFPSEDRIEGAVQLHITDRGVAHIQENVDAFLSGFGLEGLFFPIPPQCSGDTRVCCRNPDPGCRADLELTNVELTPKAPSSMSFSLRSKLQTSSDLGDWMPLKVGSGVLAVDCKVVVDTERSGKSDLLLSGEIAFEVSEETGTTRLNVSRAELSDLDDGDIDISGNLACGVVNLFKPLFMGVIVDQFSATLGQTIEEQLCLACPGQDPVEIECGDMATACEQGKCMMGDRCLQTLGVEGRARLGETLEIVSSRLNDVHIDASLLAGGWAKVDDEGIAMGFSGGARPPEGQAPACVAPYDVPPPEAPAVPRSDVFSGSAEAPVDSDVGIGVHRSFIERASWAAWKAGAMCVDVVGPWVEQINSEVLGLLVPSLEELAWDGPVPMLIALRPKNPPKISLGENTTELDEGGVRKIVSPLVEVDFDDLQIALFALIEQRYVEVMTVTGDVALPVALEVDGDGGLVPILGDLEKAVSDLRVSGTELLEEDPEVVSATFEMVLNLTTPAIAKMISGIALPEMMGVSLYIPRGGLTSVDDKEFLAVFADLSAPPAAPPTQTEASLRGLEVPPTKGFVLDKSFERRNIPRMTLEVFAKDGDERSMTASEFEWQYRIDGGFWSAFQSARRIEVASPLLLLQAVHEVEVRARRIGRPETLDATPVSLMVRIDTVPPVLEWKDGRLRARDAVSPASELRYWFVGERLGGEGRGWVEEPEEMPAGTREVRVKDAAGNVAKLALTDRGECVGGAEGLDTPAACAVVSVGYGESGLFALLLLTLAALAFACRRPAGRPLFAAIFFGAMALGCNDQGSTEEETDSETSTISDSSGESDSELLALEPGAIGRHSDMCVRGDDVFVSGYEAAYGDLMVGRADDSGEVDWKILDGVPVDSPSVYDPAGYRRGITAAGSDVGRDSSIAAGQNGWIFVAHRDATARSLRVSIYDVEGNASSSYAVDEPDEDAESKAWIGLFSSLVIDGEGRPAVAYLATNISRGDGAFVGELRVARASVSLPLDASDWTVEVVDEAPASCAGLCPEGEHCIPEVGQFGVWTGASRCEPKSTDCADVCPDGWICVATEGAAGCVEEIPDPLSEDLPHGAGLWSSMIATEQGLVAAYYARLSGDLRVAALRDDGTWRVSTLDSMGDVGGFPSLARDEEGKIFVAYQDLGGGRLLLGRIVGGDVEDRKVVDDGAREDGQHRVGADAALVIKDGIPHIFYQDQTTADLLHTWLLDDGTWTREELVAGEGGYGFYIRALLDPKGAIRVSHFAYDRSRDPIGYLEVLSL